MFKLRRYLKPFIFPVIAAIVLLFVQAICELNLPNYMSDIVNIGLLKNGIEGDVIPEGIDLAKSQTNYIIKTGAKMLGVTLIITIASILVSFIATRVAAKVAQNLRTDLFKKVQSFSDTEFEKFSTASLITRTTNDVTQIQNLIISGIRLVFFAPIMGIGALIMIINRNASMTWILGLACALIIALIIMVFVIAVPRFKKIQQLIDKLNLVSRENLSGVMVSRAFRTQEYEENRFDKVNTDLTKINLFVNRVMTIMMPAITFIMNGVMLVIVWVGADQIAASKLQIGDMMAFMQYGMHVIMSFLMMSMMFIMFPRSAVSANRINEVLETEPIIKNPNKRKKFKKDKTGYVEFKDVSFKYEGADEYVLENISFTAKPGETTAFIGSTGSGKSTLIKLVPRFNDVTSGEILVNGINVKDVPLEELQKQIGYYHKREAYFQVL